MKEHVEINSMSIAYYSTYHMLEDLFIKALQKVLFFKFREVIMGLKHIITLKMWLPSTKERAGNMDKVESNKKLINSNTYTKDIKSGKEEGVRRHSHPRELNPSRRKDRN